MVSESSLPNSIESPAPAFCSSCLYGFAVSFAESLGLSGRHSLIPGGSAAEAKPLIDLEAQRKAKGFPQRRWQSRVNVI
jgi:hypothetical protein